MTKDADIALIRLLSEDLPLCAKPYQEVADRIGSSEKDVLDTILRMQEEKMIRRIGAVLFHQRAGVSANGMGVWKVPPEEGEKIGAIMSSFSQVSHCYERPVTPEWEYNFYTMIHGKDKQECYQTARDISDKCGIKEYRLLFSVREFKKSSMKYYQN